MVISSFAWNTADDYFRCILSIVEILQQSICLHHYGGSLMQIMAALASNQCPRTPPSPFCRKARNRKMSGHHNISKAWLNDGCRWSARHSDCQNLTTLRMSLRGTLYDTNLFKNHLGSLFWTGGVFDGIIHPSRLRVVWWHQYCGSRFKCWN